jgi:hypothetical protein
VWYQSIERVLCFL